MRFVIGIDSGGTKTHMKIADMEGSILYDGYGKAGNVYANSVETVTENLRGLVFSGLAHLQLSPTKCEAFVIGSAGVEMKNGRMILSDIVRSLGFDCKIVVTTDAHTALCGGLGTTTGIVLIAGTGSICFGINASEKTHRCGGYGHILSDEGSAYDIAIRGMRTVLKSVDGRAKTTKMTDYFCQHLKLNKATELIDFVVQSKEKETIAALAQIVDKAAKEGDEEALAILQLAACDLFQMIKAVSESLFSGEEEVGVLLSGSVVTQNDMIKNELMDMTKVNMPHLSIQEEKFDAAYGAVLIALQGEA